MPTKTNVQVADLHQQLRDLRNQHESAAYALRVQIAERDAELRQIKERLDRALTSCAAWRAVGEAMATLFVSELSTGKV